MAKFISIIYTGGTVGMETTARGLHPAPLERFSPLLRSLLDHYGSGLPDFDLKASTPILDSARIMPQDWIRLAAAVADSYDRYDGFLLVMGTDTMAYAASALSFFLENLGKPVIITGAQHPLADSNSDAPANLVGAMRVLEQAEGLFEVAIYFDGKVIRGNRSMKVSSSEAGGITSPRFPFLGETTDGALSLRRDLLLAEPKRQFRFAVAQGALPRVSSLRFFPGLDPEDLLCALQDRVRGLILEMYGSGAAPDDEEILKPLRDAASRGVAIVSTTQCLRGRVDMERYRSGYALRDAGVVGGGDMTTSAAHTKLMYLLACGYSRQSICEDLRGELSSE
jgi:L-asparaginase